jgi:signal transduction histidine kinase
MVKGSLTYLCLKHLWAVVVYAWDLLKKLMKSIVSFISSIPLVWKTVVITSGLVFVEFLFLVNSYSDFYIAFWLIKNLILIPAVIYIALTLRTLQQGGIALASGDLSYHVDTKRMIWDFRKHGENLNSIANGMSIAVEDRLKSERMKTELITNVSHDIKTPLTSIINYADLIGKEKTNNKKVKEYTEVLLRQSERLKRLIDDLVEASKASTGNLEVNLMPCDAATFVNQTAGEYQDRLKECDLTLITEVPEEELRIMADGRRMYRIFDNLMNNICKYAQSGTRVYLSLERKDNDALFVFKNTSREQLNISEDELMERFTRGDQSRNTEGNGLGLSIAKSMAELQNGSLKIVIDGDLFKANLSFPIIA